MKINLKILTRYFLMVLIGGLAHASIDGAVSQTVDGKHGGQGKLNVSFASWHNYFHSENGPERYELLTLRSYVPVGVPNDFGSLSITSISSEQNNGRLSMTTDTLEETEGLSIDSLSQGAWVLIISRPLEDDGFSLSMVKANDYLHTTTSSYEITHCSRSSLNHRLTAARLTVPTDHEPLTGGPWPNPGGLGATAPIGSCCGSF